MGNEFDGEVVLLDELLGTVEFELVDELDGLEELVLDEGKLVEELGDDVELVLGPDGVDNGDGDVEVELDDGEVFGSFDVLGDVGRFVGCELVLGDGLSVDVAVGVVGSVGLVG